MSAYDMTFSNAIYGTAHRFVSRERLREMLDHEYTLLLERLGQERGDRSCFFAFANTAIVINSGLMHEMTGTLSIGVIAGLVIGKPLGIYLTCRMMVVQKIVMKK